MIAPRSVHGSGPTAVVPSSASDEQIVDCEKLAEGRWFLKDQLAGQPVSHWAKLLMALQSIVSIVVVGSVTARAVSVPS
jgi:hypothetical protein